MGSKANVHEQLKYLMAQITFFQSYHELQVIHIHGAEYKEEFDYMRWYPHLRLNAINVVGDITDEQARDQILGAYSRSSKTAGSSLRRSVRRRYSFPIFSLSSTSPSW